MFRWARKPACLALALCLLTGLVALFRARPAGKWRRLLERAKAWRRDMAPDDFSPADIRDLSTWIVESPATRAACVKRTLETGTLEERQISAMILFWACLLAEPSVGEEAFQIGGHACVFDYVCDRAFEGRHSNPVVLSLRGVRLDRFAGLLWFESEYVWKKADWPPGEDRLARVRKLPVGEERPERPWRYAHYAHRLLEFVTGRRLGRWRYYVPFLSHRPPHSRNAISYESLQEEIDAAVEQVKSMLVEIEEQE